MKYFNGMKTSIILVLLFCSFLSFLPVSTEAENNPNAYVVQDRSYFSLINGYLNYTLDANDNGFSELKEYDIYDVEGNFSWFSGTPTTALVRAFFNESYWGGKISVGGVTSINGTNFARLIVNFTDSIWNVNASITITLFERAIIYETWLKYYNTSPSSSSVNYPAPCVYLSWLAQLDNSTGQAKIYGDRWGNTQFPALITEDVAPISGQSAWIVANTTRSVGWFSIGRTENKYFIEKYDVDFPGQFELRTIYPVEWYFYQNGDTYTSPPALLILSPTGLDGMLEKYHNILYSVKKVNFDGNDLKILYGTERLGYNYGEDYVLKMIDVASTYRMDVELVHWMVQHGNWTVESWRFPNGLSYLADYAHSKDVRLILWLEPLTIANDSAVALAHPEWLINNSDGTLYVFQDPRYAESGGRYNWQNLLKPSSAEGRDWLVSLFTNLTAEGIDGFWVDLGGQDRLCRYPNAVYKEYEFTGTLVDSIYSAITSSNPDATLMGWWLGQMPWTEHGMRMGDPLTSEISTAMTHDIVNRIYWARRLYGQTAIFGEFPYITSITTAEDLNYFYGFQLASGSSYFGVVSLVEDLERLPFKRYVDAHNLIKSVTAKVLTFDDKGIVTWYNDTKTIVIFANQTVTRMINWNELDNIVTSYYMQNITEDGLPIPVDAFLLSNITLRANSTVILYLSYLKPPPPPKGVYAIEVVIAGIVAVSTGIFIAWYWRSKKKERVLRVP